MTHIEHDLHNPALGHWIRVLSDGRRLIRYDARGNGLSQREVTRVDFSAWVEDLECVVDGLGLDHFALFGMSQGATVATAYAARHPDRVSHLALHGACVRGFLKRNPSANAAAAAHAMLTAAQAGWGVDSSAFRKMFLNGLVRDSTPEQLRSMDEGQRHAVSADVAKMFLEAAYVIDISDEAPQVRCPTLIAHSDHDPCFPFSEAALLAGMIPGAQLLPLQSRNHLLMETEPAWPVVRDALQRFIPSLSSGAVSPLSPRQIEVLCHVADGHTDKEIARSLGLSPRTVEMHVARAMQALGSHTRSEAVHSASARGWLRPDTVAYSTRRPPVP